MMVRPLGELCRVLGHTFANPGLLEEALTHPSVGGRGSGVDYERLEFVGDRVLGLITADFLFTRFPEAEAGELARRLNARVRREALVKVAESIGLGDFLVLSKSEIHTGGRAKPAILADACEAVIAALYLDGGLETARRFVLDNWQDIAATLGAAEKDPKTALQEWVHRTSGGTPEYVVTKRLGPPHAPIFTVEVRVNDWPPVAGEGASKRQAQQSAAAHMLSALRERSRHGHD